MLSARLGIRPGSLHTVAASCAARRTTSLSGGVAICGCDCSGSGTCARAGTFEAGSGRLTLRGRAGARAVFTVGGPPEDADAATGGAVTTVLVFTLAISTAGA